MKEKYIKYFKGDELAGDVFMDKYRDKGETSPNDRLMSISKEIAKVELLRIKNVRLDKLPLLEPRTRDYIIGYRGFTLEEFTHMIFVHLLDFKFIIPQGGILASLGTDKIASLSNCVVMESVMDSYNSIMYKDTQLTALFKRRAGVGFDLSGIRPEGALVNNAAKTTSGLVSFATRFSNTTREVAQDGRRGALMLTCSINHPDSVEFIKSKNETDKLTGANISIKLDDKFMKAMVNDEDYFQTFPVDKDFSDIIDYSKLEYGKLVEVDFGEVNCGKVEGYCHRGYVKRVKAKEVWDILTFQAWKSAEPGILNWDAVTNGPDGVYEEYKPISTNPCYAKNTKIITDKGLFNIEDLIGKSVNILSQGKKITVNNFRITGRNQPMIDIKLKDGSELRVTEYHDMILENGERVKAKYLKRGDKLKVAKYETHGNIEAKGAYIKGFIIGDGTLKNGNPLLKLYHTKYMCGRRLIESTLELNPTNTHNNRALTEVKLNNELNGGRILTGLTARKDDLRKWSYAFKHKLPKEIFNWTLKSKSEFIAGLFDADGSASDNSHGFNYQLTSIHKNLLLDVQMLLKTLGVYSTVSNLKKEELKDFNDGYKKYETKKSYRLFINQKNAIRLSQFINFERLKDFSNKVTKYNIKDKFNIVTSITKSGNDDTVYCCTVPDTHSLGIGLGVESGNCGEIPMSQDSCRLMTMNLFSYINNPFDENAHFNREMFSSHVFKAMRWLDVIVDLEVEHIDRIIAKIKQDTEPDETKQIELKTWEDLKKKGLEGRRLGLGLTGIGDAFAAMNIKYADGEDILDEIMKTKLEAELEATIDMGITEGVFKGWSRVNEFGEAPIRTECESDSDCSESEICMNGYSYPTKPIMNNHFYALIYQLYPRLSTKMMAYGRRNVSWSTFSPTGTVSMMAQVTSGIEPLFKPFYIRRKKAQGDDRVVFVDEMGDKWTEYPVIHHKFKDWIKFHFRENGEDVDIKALSEESLKNLFKVSPWYGSRAEDINWEDRINIQAVLQRYTTHSISSTINLPSDATVEQISDIYYHAWLYGLKGVTVYRDGSRSGVLVSSDTKPTKEYKKRPKSLKAVVIPFNNYREKWIALIGLRDDRPYEIFTFKGVLNNVNVKVGTIDKTKSKDGNTYDFRYEGGMIPDIGRLNDSKEFWNIQKLLSGLLREGMSLKYVIKTIESLNLDGAYINTWKRGIVRGLNKFIENEDSNIKCPVCGVQLVREEGCLHCNSCGYSKCG